MQPEKVKRVQRVYRREQKRRAVPIVRYAAEGFEFVVAPGVIAVATPSVAAGIEDFFHSVRLEPGSTPEICRIMAPC